MDLSFTVAVQFERTVDIQLPWETILDADGSGSVCLSAKYRMFIHRLVVWCGIEIEVRLGQLLYTVCPKELSGLLYICQYPRREGDHLTQFPWW